MDPQTSTSALFYPYSRALSIKQNPTSPTHQIIIYPGPFSQFNTMRSFVPAFWLLSIPISSAQAIQCPGSDTCDTPAPNPECLSYTEALDIATRWLHIWWTGDLISKSQLSTIVTDNIASYDETFGGPTLNLDELFTEVDAASPSNSGPSKVTNVTQSPLFLIQSCDGIAVRWEYKGVTTGYNSYVLLSHRKSHRI
jgi:hypothetical protein